MIALMETVRTPSASMRRLSFRSLFTTLLLPGGLILFLGCQGDDSTPDSLTRALDGAAPCPWADPVDDVYASGQDRSAKRRACRAIDALVSDGQFGAAEQGINELLAALNADYAACVGGVFDRPGLPPSCELTGGAAVDPAAVVAFAQATCDLGASFLPQSGDVDCVVPSVANLAEPTTPGPGEIGFDPTAEVAGGWIVDLLYEGDTIVLPNGEFAQTADDFEDGVTAAYVALRENPPAAALGYCPGASSYDCVPNSYVADWDELVSGNNDPIGEGTGLGGLYTEACEGDIDFADTPGRCAGGVCAQAANAVDPPRGILSCTEAALDFRASTWTVVGGDPAARDVVCEVTSQSAAISEGTLCRIKEQGGDFLAGKQCVTVADGQFTSSCTISGVPAADPALPPGDPVAYTMVAEKQVGTGSHYGETDFEISQSAPPLGTAETVSVLVVPQGQQ